MAQVTIKDVKYTNVPNKKVGAKVANRITQSNIGMSQSVADYLASDSFYKLVGAIDIDWNGIEIDENIVLNDTSDLINWISSLVSEITPSIGSNGNWYIGNTDTGVYATSLKVEVVGDTLQIK